MDSIESMLQQTQKISLMCKLAVHDMKNLKKDMQINTNLYFDSEIYHNYCLQTRSCTMCVVGSLARGFGLSDNHDWQRGRSGYFYENQIMKNRFRTLNSLREGCLIFDFYFAGWNKSLSVEKWRELKKEFYRIYKNNRPRRQTDIMDFIKLYKHYAELFEKFGI